MSVKTRFLSSVSGVALTAVLMAAAMPAQADSDSANGTAQALGPGFNQNTTVTTVPVVDAISSDPANTVEVTGIVYGDAAFNHLNAIGVYVDQFDIQAADAFDSQTGLAVSALASNSATVSGSIIGTILNPDFAPGSNSYGVRVTEDIAANNAQAYGSYDGAGDPAVTAIARNTISAAGSVAGSAIDSFGVRVDGDVYSAFAYAEIDIRNYTDPSDIAVASARALNVVSIAGQVGGEGASDGSVGFYVGGDVYAEGAIADGDTYIYIPALSFGSIYGSSVWGAGQVSSDSVARNTVEITGAVIGDGGNLATGVYIDGGAFAEGAFAAGEAVSDGFQDVASAARMTLTTTNSVAIEGTVSGLTGPAMGVDVGAVWAEGAGAIGESIAAFTPGEGGGTPSALAEIAVVAGNAVSITGIASSEGGVGVDVDGSVYAEGATAEGFAGANIYEGSGVPVADAVAAAQASNAVVVTGLAQANDAIGVAIGDDVYAEDAETEVVASAYATFAAVPEGTLALADASASVTSAASNAVSLHGSVDAGLANAIGVDPDDVTAEDAYSELEAYAFASSLDGLGALASVAGDGTASNAASVTGTIGSGASAATGVGMFGEVEAQYAYADSYAAAEAIQTNINSVSTAGATATAVNAAAAINSAVVTGVLGDSVTGSTGVDIGQDVDAEYADAWGGTYADATVAGGDVANALATAEGSVSASNEAVVTGVAGNNAIDSFGVRMDGFDSELWYSGVNAGYAEGDGYARSNAYNYDGSGNATASAAIGVGASSTASIAGSLGDDAVNSFGVWIGEGHVAAHDSSVFGEASTWAEVFGQGDATATSANTLSANNLAVVAGTLGNGAEGSTGVWLGEGGVEAVFAEGFGEGYAYATLAGGDDSNALAEAGSSVTAGNVASVAVVLGDEANGSTGAWISEGAGAFGAFAEGSTSAYAYNQATAGNATATATNSVKAQNQATVGATLGNDAINSAGVYIGEGVLAVDAFAEGSAYAEAQTANGIASATTTNDVSAANITSLAGVLGSGAEGSAGIVADAGSYVFVPFFGEAQAGAGAIGATAEGSAHARASLFSAIQGEGGAGTAEATATNDVSASNVVAITGMVGTDGVDSVGAVLGEGAAMAAFAEAIGEANAYASLSDDISGDAIAQAEGSVVASNAVTVVGTVGDTSADSYGVLIDRGQVNAALAEGSGYFYAEANRNGDENGNATAGVGLEGAAAAVVAANAVDIDGTTSGVNAEGGGLQDNVGVYVDDDVEAVDAIAEGSFVANAYRGGSGDGSAMASVFGDVAASNAVVITGAVTAGASAEGAAGGEGSSGVWIGDDVRAEYAEASGDAYAYADRGSGDATGDATARASLGTSAVNAIVITGEVASNNDDSTGVHVGDSVVAVYAFAEGSAMASAYNNVDGSGSAIANAANDVEASNVIAIDGLVDNSQSNDSAGVYIGEGVAAVDAFAEGSAYAAAESNNADDGSATATAANASSAVNSIAISGVVGDDVNDDSVGVYIGEGITARSAFAEGSALANASRLGAGEGIATATATDATSALNFIAITGIVGVDSYDAYGVDPLFVEALNANASSSATANANGPAGSTATATAAAAASNVVTLTGNVAGNASISTRDSTGLFVANDVTAFDAFASASTSLTLGGSATGTATATASATNIVAIGGEVGENGENNFGSWIGGDIRLGWLGVELDTTIDGAGDTTSAVATATGTMANVAVLDGAVGDDMVDSRGVHVGGGLFFEGDVGVTLALSLNVPGLSTATVTQVVEGMNIAAISGAVGANSARSQGVYIGGNIEVTNSLVSNFVIEGTDATNDGTTRGVWIGGSVLTGDAPSSQLASSASNINAPEPTIPAPQQVGDYVELAGSVFIGANGGLNPYGVAVGGGNDTVLVRDTHFQMDVVNGFDGGDNEVDGQDVIVFDNAQTYVSNVDNFEVMNVTDRSAVILTNPAPYIYAVQDEVNVNYHGILSFGDGGAPPPPPIAGGSPVNTLRLDTPMLTIGGIAGVKTPGPGFDDSILKAENNGTGSYEINGDVFNFGTITLSKVLSPVRGTDPHGLAGDGATSFDDPAEQQAWTSTGSWALDPNSAAGDRLVINGNYTAGSNIIVDAFVFKTGSASDTVVINGNVAGLTTIWVNNTNAFGQGAQTGNGPTDGILLVDVNSAQDPAVVGQAFVLGNASGWGPEEMQVGAFIYDLRQGGDGRDFYLQSTMLDQVPAYSVVGSALRQHFYAELGTLYQRMGELRHADTGPKANSSFFEFWLRAYGQDVEMDPKKGFGFDMNSKGFMVGGDYAIRNWVAPQSRLHLGGFGGFGTSKIDDVKGGGDADGKIDSYTLGLYASYFDTAKKGQGLYADAVAKINFLESEISSSARSTKAKSDDFAWGASLEVGYGIGLGNGFIIQPQGQLSYMQVGKEKYKESKTPGIPLEIERDKAESLRGRLGLQLQNTWTTPGGTQFSPYVIGNVLHEFMGDSTTTVSGTEFRNDMGGTWYNAGAGFSLDFDNVGLYGHVEYNFGNRVEGLGAGLGVKVRLGGATPVAATSTPAPAPAVAPKKNFLVFFDFDRSNITADAQRVIDEAVSAAKAGNVARMQLTGHTDRSGSEQYNLALSLRRGEAVKQALIARGIPAASISIIGRGESQPLVPTADGVREPQNRRVEILL